MRTIRSCFSRLNYRYLYLVCERREMYELVKRVFLVFVYWFC